MSTINSNLLIGKKDNAFFTANPTLVLLDGQLIYNEDTGDLFIGNNVTQLSALTAINGSLPTGVLFNTDIGVTVQGYDADTTILGNSTSANQIVLTDGSNNLSSLGLGANQSIRRNSANTAYEAFTSGYSTQDFPYIGRWFHGLCSGGRLYTQTSPTQIWYAPILFSTPVTLDGMAFIMSNTGTTFRMGIYDTDSSSRPNNRLYDSGNITSTGNAFYSHTISSSITLQPGMYFLAFCNSANATGGVFKLYSSVTDSTSLNIGTDRGPIWHGTAVAYGALPATAGAVGVTASAQAPLIFLRRSA